MRVSQEGRDELSERVQRALSLGTKKEPERRICPLADPASLVRYSPQSISQLSPSQLLSRNTSSLRPFPAFQSSGAEVPKN